MIFGANTNTSNRQQMLWAVLGMLDIGSNCSGVEVLYSCFIVICMFSQRLEWFGHVHT